MPFVLGRIKQLELYCSPLLFIFCKIILSVAFYFGNVAGRTQQEVVVVEMRQIWKERFPEVCTGSQIERWSRRGLEKLISFKYVVFKYVVKSIVVKSWLIKNKS
jgi:hypothetical protein